MDPVLLFLIGLVILFYFLLMITLVRWAKRVIGKKNERRGESPQESDILAKNVADFTLAYYERTKARTEKKRKLTNTAMKLCWERLPRGFQKKLAILGGLANLKVGGNSSS